MHKGAKIVQYYYKIKRNPDAYSSPSHDSNTHNCCTLTLVILCAQTY